MRVIGDKEKMLKKHKKIEVILAIILVCLYYIFHIVKVKPVLELKADNIRIMSYNIKYAGSDYEQWEKRKDKLAQQILEYRPDSIGIQEGDYEWMSEYGGLPELLEGYDFVGVGRDDGGSLGEYAAIFYLRDKYEVIDEGTFWLSETSETPSLGWDAACNRICTWVLLRNKDTGEVYKHYNTHLDHVGKVARIKGINLLLNEIEKCEIPFVLTGDFNITQDSSNYKLIIDSGLLEDSKFAAKDSMSHGTMNWFLHVNFKHFKPIDFCFVSKEDIEVDTYRVDNTYWVAGHPVSDHYPVIVDLRVNKFKMRQSRRTF